MILKNKLLQMQHNSSWKTFCGSFKLISVFQGQSKTRLRTFLEHSFSSNTYYNCIKKSNHITTVLGKSKIKAKSKTGIMVLLYTSNDSHVILRRMWYLDLRSWPYQTLGHIIYDICMPKKTLYSYIIFWRAY